MVGEALKKLQAEINAADKKDPYTPVIGGFMMKRVQEHPEDAERVLAEGKTIAGSVKSLWDAASKIKHNNQAIMTDEEGYRIVLQYYGIAVPQAARADVVPAAPSFDVDLDALLN